MTRLSVNINKIATIRNSRGKNNPELIQVALDCEKFGAEGITIHPRPDERHIRYADAYALNKVVTTEFNIEGNPIDSFIKLVSDIVPDQVTLVPDGPEAVTSNAGWDTISHESFLTEVISHFKSLGIRTSVFLDPNPKYVAYAKKCGADRIELYTENYALQYTQNPSLAIKPYIETAKLAIEYGLELNAGHDLDLENLKYFQEKIPSLKEVSIGHALICDALYAGLEPTIKAYLKVLS